jgi:hypothetical protein
LQRQAEKPSAGLGTNGFRNHPHPGLADPPDQYVSVLACDRLDRARVPTRSTTTGAADGPAGMRGALRRAGGGRQPMAFIGRRHFNDARLIEERFRLTEP